MQVKFIIVLLLFNVELLVSQSFSFSKDDYNYHPGPHFNFQENLGGICRVADMDNDGLEDLVIFGERRKNRNDDYYAIRIYFQTAKKDHWEVTELGVFNPLITPNAENSILELGDIDLDGDLDILGLSSESVLGGIGVSLNWYENMGSRIFIKDTFFGVNGPEQAFLMDMDNDGDLDITYTTSDIQSMGLFLNDGSGSCQVDTLNNFPYMRETSLAVGDLDGDDIKEILVAGKFGTSRVDSLIIYQGHSNGQYGISHLPAYNLKDPGGFLVDLDSDGDLDYIVQGTVQDQVDQHLCLYVNNGIGFFSKQILFSDPTIFTGSGHRIIQGERLFFRDIVGDSLLDIIDLSSRFGLSQVFENKGNNVFSLNPNPPFPLHSGFLAMAEGDLDNDGSDDLVRISQFNFGSGNIWGDLAKIEVYKRNSAGDWTVGGPIIQNAHSRLDEGIAIKDINGDGNEDLLVSGVGWFARQGTFAYLNDGLGNFHVSNDSILNLDSHILANKFVDIDSDGDIDIFRYSGYPFPNQIVEIFENDGAGNFTLSPKPVPQVGFDLVRSFCVQDFNGDSYMDLAYFGTDMDIYLNDGNQNFQLDTTALALDFYYALSDDYDQDGDNDILAQTYQGLELYENNGSARFTRSLIRAVNSNTIKFRTKVGDLNHDGFKDLVFVKNPDKSGALTGIEIFENNKDGTFSQVPFQLSGYEFISAHIFDADNNGNNELLIMAQRESDEQKLRSFYSFDSTFSFVSTPDTSLEFMRLAESDWTNDPSYASADLDSDGDEDLVMAGYTTFGKRTFFYRNNALGGVGVKELQSFSNLHIELYPNPNSGQFRLRTFSDQPQQFRLFNLQGQLLRDFTSMDDELLQFNLNPGLYFMTTTKNGVKQSLMFWVEN